jgi:hypothetical protein
VDHSAALTRTLIAVACAIVVPACTALRRRPSNDYGVQRCPPEAIESPLSVDALQCWFSARNGRWRILKRESHLDVLVVQAEAFDLRDAEEIASRFVARERDAFEEVLVYVHSERPSERGRVRRVQWTREKGLEPLDFMEPANEREP